jgi:hypothetical protein
MAQPNQQRPQTSTLEYLIVDPIANAPMKAIPLQNLPTFHGLISEDPDAFLFEFDVLCRGYDYTSEPQKLKLFPSTLKGAALRWFMGLGGGTINSWDEMKQAFLTKYQDYCRTRDLKDEIFQMTAKENETLEEYVERFQYNLQRSPYGTLPGEVLKATLIKGMKDEWVETLNLMGKGDIYQETYDNIVLLCIRCSRGSTQTRSGMQTSLTRNSNITSGGVTRAEVGNLLENFKTDILSTLTTQLDVLQAKQKQAEAEQTLAIFFHRCRKKHGPRECPLDVVRVCAICAKDHATEQCPSLPGLKVVFREAEEETKPLYLMAQRRQWQARPPNTLRTPPLSFLDSIINNKILVMHGRANHLLIRTGSPNNTHLQIPLGRTNPLQIPSGRINQLQVPPGLTHNTPPHPGKTQITTPTLRSGPTRLPKTQIGTRIGSAPWG